MHAVWLQLQWLGGLCLCPPAPRSFWGHLHPDINVCVPGLVALGQSVSLAGARLLCNTSRLSLQQDPSSPLMATPPSTEAHWAVRVSDTVPLGWTHACLVTVFKASCHTLLGCGGAQKRGAPVPEKALGRCHVKDVCLGPSELLREWPGVELSFRGLVLGSAGIAAAHARAHCRRP